MSDAPKFKKVRQVTLQVLKLTKNQARYIGILSPIFSGKKIDDQKEAAQLVKAVDLETGEMGLVICPKIMQSELNANYPGESYVRKCFEIVVTPVPGARYNNVALCEVAEPDDFKWPNPDTGETASAGETPAAKSAKK